MTARDAGRVAVWREDDTVYAALLPGGPIIVLRETAAAIWNAAGSVARDEVADRVAADLGVRVDDIRPSVDEFLEHLAAEGFLTDSG